jgi:hypothetical protein
MAWDVGLNRYSPLQMARKPLQERAARRGRDFYIPVVGIDLPSLRQIERGAQRPLQSRIVRLAGSRVGVRAAGLMSETDPQFGDSRPQLPGGHDPIADAQFRPVGIASQPVAEKEGKRRRRMDQLDAPKVRVVVVVGGQGQGQAIQQAQTIAQLVGDQVLRSEAGTSLQQHERRDARCVEVAVNSRWRSYGARDCGPESAAPTRRRTSPTGHSSSVSRARSTYERGSTPLCHTVVDSRGPTLGADCAIGFVPA